MLYDANCFLLCYETSKVLKHVLLRMRKQKRVNSDKMMLATFMKYQILLDLIHVDLNANTVHTRRHHCIRWQPVAANQGI
jgi:hypothetical protein